MSSNEQRYGGLSGEAVARATGRDWDAWLELLDGLGAREMDHKEIVALIAGPGGLSSGWWQQSVAVGYEQARGLRVVGQTSAGGFQIGVQMTLPVSAGEAWDLLMEGPGRDTWLGTADGVEFRKGERYRTSEGVSGEVRSIVPGERVRLIWSSPLPCRSPSCRREKRPRSGSTRNDCPASKSGNGCARTGGMY